MGQATSNIAAMQQLTTWWDNLSDSWKMAFNEAVLHRPANTEQPDHESLRQIFETPVLRLAGPTAPYPNMSFELKDLSGISELTHLEILVVTHHQVRMITELRGHKKLKSLFVFDNQIENLAGIENLTGLQELYCHNNYIDTLEPLAKLTNLHTLYCSSNQIKTLEGIGKQHVANMQKLYCLPNTNLRDPEILRFEREIGIRCLRN